MKEEVQVHTDSKHSSILSYIIILVDKTRYYHFKVLILISIIYAAIIYNLDVNNIIKIGLLLFNPYVWYGLLMMWINKEQLKQAYYMMQAFWRARKN